jgi:hypothetical protein
VSQNPLDHFRLYPQLVEVRTEPPPERVPAVPALSDYINYQAPGKVIEVKCAPLFRGLFLAFPAIFPATASLVEKHEIEKKQRAGINGTMRSRNAVALEARGAAMGSIGLAVFAIVVWKFLSGEPPWVVLAAAGLAWLVTSMLIWQSRRVILSNRFKLKHAGQTREA